MAVIKAVDVVNRCTLTLKDPNNARWTKSELLKWLNSGQRQIVKFRHDANAVHRIQALVAGTKQALQAGDLRLLRALRNMGVGGATPGDPISIITIDEMDIQDPNWHAATPAAVVERLVYDGIDPKVFYAYPPQPGAGQGSVELVVVSVPTDCTINGVDAGGADSVLSVDDIYEDDLYNFVMSKALSKEAAYANPLVGNSYYQLFAQSMGISAKADAGTDPNMRDEK